MGDSRTHLWSARYQRSSEELDCVWKAMWQICVRQGPFPGKSSEFRGLYQLRRGWRPICLQGGRKVSTVPYSG